MTAGGLIFIAAATDDLIKAIDIETGEILWSDVLPAGGQATPIVYEQNGKEYLVIMAGGHHFMMTPPGDALIASPCRTRSERCAISTTCGIGWRAGCVGAGQPYGSTGSS